MSSVLWMVRNMLLTFFKKKKRLLIIVGLPIIGVLVSMLIYGGSDNTNVKIGVVDEDQTHTSLALQRFLQQLDHTKVYKLKEKEAEDQLVSGKLDVVIGVPENFSESLMTKTPEQLSMKSIKGSQVTSYVQSFLSQYTNNLVAIAESAENDATTFQQMLQQYQNSEVSLKSKAVADTSKNKNITNQSMGYLIMFMLFAAFNLAIRMNEERDNRTYFRLLMSPVQAKQYVLAHVAVNYCMMLVQIFITLSVMKFVIHIDTGIAYAQMGVVLALFGLVAVGLSLFIVTVTKNNSTAKALQNLIIVPSCMLTGCFFPSEFMPKIMQKISSFLPQHWVLSTFNRIQEGQSFTSLYLHLLILIAFAVTFFLLAVYRIARTNSVQHVI